MWKAEDSYGAACQVGEDTGRRGELGGIPHGECGLDGVLAVVSVA